MCGIVGYAGPSGTTGVEAVLEGLARLEYRGYDSAGVAVVDGDRIDVRKKAGRLDGLIQELTDSPLTVSETAIGHTRWATHGGPTDANAHPHVSFDGKVALVHNGIIENANDVAKMLDGVERVSDTDTEVVAHLLAQKLTESESLLQAMMKAVAHLEGSFTLVAISPTDPGRVVAARRNSPLVVGVGEGENFVGSDVAAFVGRTTKAIEVDQDQIVEITADSIAMYTFGGDPVEGRSYEVDWDADAAVKGGYETFMDKEIHEQPTAVADTLRGRMNDRGFLQLDELRIDEHILRSIDKIIVVACGTASYAGYVAKYAIEHWCRVPVEVELAHEFRYRDAIVSEKTLVVAISQSGETMDTLQAIRHASEQGAKVLAIVNTHGSSIARESDAVLYTHAGPEVAVASTKAFIAQITAAYLLGLYLAQIRGHKYPDEVGTYLDELGQIPDKIQAILDQEDEIRQLAIDLKDTTSVLFLGRHVGYPIALEGALKLKELAYIHAEGFAAGELKHGPIALVEEGQPIFFIVPTPRRPLLHAKVISNVQEVRARGANVFCIAEEGDTAVDEVATKVIRVPKTPTLMMPLVTVVPLQIFACALAGAKGLDVDRPRNLAKSVTVE